MDSELFTAAASGNEIDLGNFSANVLMKQETSQKNCVLHVAVLHNQIGIVRILKSHRSLLYRQNTNGDTPLHLAARLGLDQIAQELIESAKKDYYPRSLRRKLNREKDSALHDAARNGHLTVVDLLIEEDGKLALLTNSAGESPLFLALERKFFDIVRHLLDTTEKCSLSGRRGMNALHLAVIYLNIGRNGEGSATAFQVLNDLMRGMICKCPSALGEQDNLGWTPLHYAAHYGVEEVVELFLNNDKSSAYKRDKEGMIAFHVATKRGEVQILTRTMTFCPDVCEVLTYNGQNALHVAVSTRNNNAVQYLLTTLNSGGLLSQQDKDGNTPLHLAAIIEEFEILDELLHMLQFMFRNGEKVNQYIINKDGLTAMDIIVSSRTIEEPRKGNFVTILRSVDCIHGLHQQLIERNIQLQAPQLESENQSEENKNNSSHFMLFLRPFLNPRFTERAASVDIVLATLIATVTFAVVFQIPGGYQSSGTPSVLGLPILKEKSLFKVFIIFNSLAFGLSSSSILLHFLGSMRADSKNPDFLQIAKLTTFYSILATVGTFFSAIYLISGSSRGIHAAAYVSLAAFLIGPLYLRYLDFLLWIKVVLPHVNSFFLFLFPVFAAIFLFAMYMLRLFH